MIAILEWRKAEIAKLHEQSLEGADLRQAKLAITMEVGRRFKKAEGRAKYRNSPRKLLERDALAAIDAESSEGPRRWTS